MTTKASAGAPSSYEEMFKDYFGYVKSLLRQLGIKDTEDFAQEVMIKFMERDFLDVYDPTAVTRHGQPTTFKAFLGAFVERYSRHWRERQALFAQREPVICDKPLSSGLLWVEVYATPQTVPFEDVVLEGDLICLIRERLGEIPVRGKRDLLRLFDILLPQLREGKLNRQLTAEQYGVSSTVIGSMLADLRAAISFLAPLPAW